jgi:hypothetical protein
MGALIDIDAGLVLVLITLIVLPIAAIAFARSGPAWKELGKGPLAIEQTPPPSPSQAGEPADRALQEAEARQMLEAKSYRRQARGEAPIDVEAEVRRALDMPNAPPAEDEELRAEIRRLVVARNERRLRQGEEALDVEAEIERQLAEFA